MTAGRLPPTDQPTGPGRKRTADSVLYGPRLIGRRVELRFLLQRSLKGPGG